MLENVRVMKLRHFRIWICAVIVSLTCLGVVFLAPRTKAENPGDSIQLPAAFDRSVPIPPDDPNIKIPNSGRFLQFKSFDERLAFIRALSPKPVVFPEGLAEFIHDVDAKSNRDKGDVLFLSEYNGRIGGKTVRECLDTALSDLSLSWNYDPKRDVVLTDFQWHCDDPRSARELAAFLTANRPPPSQRLILHHLIRHPTSGNRLESTGVPWFDTFDALLSKPENLPQVWKLRFIDDARRYVLEYIFDNLLADKVRDEKGTEHILFVNDEPKIVSEGEGYISYYVFDLNGKFERGGIIGSGRRCGNSSMWLNGSGDQLTLRGFFNSRDAVDTNFVLTDQGLVSKDQTAWSAQLGIGKVVYLTNPE
jgi:hypothetical protein